MQNKLKLWLSKKSNIFTLILLAFVIWRQAPTFMNNQGVKGKVLQTSNYAILNANLSGDVPFPPKDSKAIAIFWATWCGPCKVEMNRLQKSVESGKIPQEKIYAINPFEPKETSRKFLIENKYPFTFIDATDVSSALNIEVTPTTIFIDKGVVTSAGSGMSLLGIWRAEFFLN